MFKALTDIVRDNTRTDNQSNRRSRQPTRFPVAAMADASNRGSGVAFIDPSDAVKSSGMGLFSRNALEFINSASNEMSSPYTEQQLLNAYLTSVYVYAALRRVSNLISRVKIVGEIQQDGKWVRLPETHMLNQLFARDGSETMSRMWLNHAVYGAANVYKIKTRRAMLEEQAGRPIFDFADGAVAGLYVLDKPLWDIDEDVTYGAIRGFYVNQYESGDNLLGNRNYLQREEVIYYTDWNPQNPNRGKSMVAVCIHEAVANASIAQWISEYFTRGAMPFIMVSMAEDDPAMMTDSDLRKYKKQFEEYWQGMGSSLRSVFFDRQIKTEQVGISADEVAAPDLNETALEGIAATMGLDRELIVTPSGGSQERHALLVKRAWEDTVIPLAEKYISSINRDLGLPPNMRLVVDVSGIAELEADRENKADTEISIYDSHLQSYNETRTRLKMSPVKELDGFYNLDGRLVPLSQLVALGNIPHGEIVDYAMQLWDSNLARRSEVLAIIGRQLPDNSRDGYKYEIEERSDLIQSMWGDDLLPRTAVLQYLGFPVNEFGDMDDGYRSELERGADYGEWVTKLWDDNLLTRSQTLEMLDMGLSLPAHAPDGYADEIGDRKSNIMDMWGDNLLTRGQTLDHLGYEPPNKMIDGYTDEVEMKLEMVRDAENERVERIMDFWGDNLLTRGQVLDAIGIERPADMIDGYTDEVGKELDAIYEADETIVSRTRDLWGDNLLTRGQALNTLGINAPSGMIDGYTDEVGNIADEVSSKIGEFEAEEVAATYNPNGEEGVRTLYAPSHDDGYDYEDPDDFDPDDPNNPPPPSSPPPTQDGADDWIEIERITADPIDDLLYEIEQAPDDDAIEAAEEDLLEGYGGYVHDVLEPNYGDMIDVLPAEVLPEAEMGEDELYDIDSWLNDSELEVRDSRFYGDGDYYDNVAAAFDDELHVDEVLSIEDMDAIEEEVLDEIYDGVDVPYRIPEIQVPMFEPTDDFELPVEEVDRGASENTAETTEETEVDVSEPVDIDETVDATGATSTVDRINPDTRENEEEGEDLYVSLWIGYEERLVELQDKLDDLMGDDPDIEWQDPETFHITLVYAPDASDEDMENVLGVLPDNFDNLTLKVVGLSTFDNEDQTVIKLDIEPSDELVQLQAKLATAFNTYGIALSPFSNPASYNPHVTLAYAPPKTHVPEVDAKMFLRPDVVSLGRDGYDLVEEIEPEEVASLLQFDGDMNVEVEGDVNVDISNDNIVEVSNDNIVEVSDERIIETGDDSEVEVEFEFEEEHDEPDGAGMEEFMSERQRREEAERWQHMLRNNWCSKVRDWYLGRERFGDVVELPPHIMRALNDFVVMGKLTDRVIDATIESIQSGALDDEDWEVNPVKDAVGRQKARQANASEELGAWERATLKRGIRKGLRFETEHVDSELTGRIKEQLESLEDGDAKSIKDIFTQANLEISDDD